MGYVMGGVFYLFQTQQNSTNKRNLHCFRSNSHRWNNRKSHCTDKENELPLLIINEAEVWLYGDLGSQILIYRRLLKVFLNQLLVSTEKKETIAHSQQWFELIHPHCTV